MLSHFSRVRLFVTLWTVACQVSLSRELSRKEYWSGEPFPSSGNLPNPGIKLWSPALQAEALPTELLGMPRINTEVCIKYYKHLINIYSQ